MIELALSFLAGVACFFGGYVNGFFHWRDSVRSKHIEWLRQHGDRMKVILSEMQAFMLECEDYHRSIVAWQRGREKSR